MRELRTYFDELAQALGKQLFPAERSALYLNAEESLFLRFSRGKVRQAGTVSHLSTSLSLCRGHRSPSHSLDLLGQISPDLARLTALLPTLRTELEQVPDDPYLNFPEERHDSEQVQTAELPTEKDLPAYLLGPAEGLDLTGIYAGGPIYRGYANSGGQRNWFQSDRFTLDWSLYNPEQKAVKQTYCGEHFEPSRYLTLLDEGRRHLELFGRPTVRLEPGEYPAYLAPQAVADLFETTAGWGGFSLKAHRDKISPLQLMVDQDRRFSPAVSLSEDLSSGLVPRFNETGFLRPERTALIKEGALDQFLVSPRTSREFSSPCNGAREDEVPTFLCLDGGGVPVAEALQRLGDGLYLGNLHYLNFSDKPKARVTGMTRFSCFTVKGGLLTAPIEKMRFDDTLYNLFGEHFRGFTDQPETLLSTSTYVRRDLAGGVWPGLLVSAFRFTL